MLSDVATEMFLEDGFDAVRVVDVARACGVTEKTVYNHFATKEALLADRWEAMTTRLADLLVSGADGPLEVALSVLSRELDDLLPRGGDTSAAKRLRDTDRFLVLVARTPALRAHQREALSHLVSVTARALAVRRGDLQGAEPQDWVVASAVAGLWVVFSLSLTAALEHHRADIDAGQVRSQVTADLGEAAKTLQRGL